MPVVGNSSDKMRTFGDFPMVPEKYQAAMRFGIPLFELRLRGRSDNDQLLYGPFDVRVTEFFDTVRRRDRYSDKWMTDNNAHIRYEVDNRGTGVAFMPDDKFWHNRLILMNNPGLHVMQYHTKDGILPGSIVNAELDCLRGRLKADVPIWRVMEDGREKDFFFTEDEANAFIEEQDQAIPTLDKQTGQIKNVQAKRRKFKVVKGSKLVYKPEILKIIKTEGQHQFGWTECLYFQDQIKPEVEEMMKERNESNVQQDDESVRRGSIMKDIMGLSAEEKIRLKQELGLSSIAAPEGEAELPPPPTPGGIDKAFVWEKRTKGALNRMTIPQLQTILRGRGFGVDGLSKPHIVYKILETDKGIEEPKEQEVVT